MKTKNFVLAGIAGGITDYLLGWLLYGMIFRDNFPDEMPNMLFIFLGCMTFGFLLSYVLIGLANLTTYATGAKVGAILSLLVALMSNFFMRASSLEVDYTLFALDVVIMLIMGAIVGAIVAAVNGAMSRTTT